MFLFCPPSASPEEPGSLETLLHDAIYDNDLKLVKECLEKGADPNAQSRKPPLHVIGFANSYTWVASIFGKDACVFPIHFAILNCIYSDVKGRAFEILKALLTHGAEPNSGITNVKVLKVVDKYYHWATLPPECKDTRGFVRFLLSCLRNEYRQNVSRARSVLQDAYHVPPCYQARTLHRDNVLATMDELLLSERFSDVRFVCPDGTVLYAHCSILSAKSDYFAAVFEGPWKNTCVDGRWETTNSSSVIDAILRFIYVGKIVPQVLQTETISLFEVSTEYQMEDLQGICVQQLASNLSEDTIKDTLLLACLHDISILKEACSKFVKAHSLELGASNVLGDLAKDARTFNIWKDLVSSTKHPADTPRN